MKYCSNCGSEQMQFIIPTHDNRQRWVCGNCSSIFYSNPRIIVGCLAFWEGRVLLARRNIEPRFGLWNLPAGFLENGETIEAGAVREVYEETKAEVEIIKPFVLYNLPKANQLYIHFLGRLKSPHTALTPESSEIKLFDFKDIPWDEMAFTSSTYALKMYMKHGENGGNAIHLGQYPQ
jgi:ADP-ribose pyrophosphatase YjhB (NUDIX family)